MSLTQQIENDYQQAFKAKEESVVSVLRLLRSALKNEEIAKKEKLTDDEVIKILKTEIKKRKESIDEYKKADRDELADKEQAELVILEKYLPQQMSEDQINEIADKVIADNPDANFGQVMGQVMAQTKGQADGQLVKQIVEQKLKS